MPDMRPPWLRDLDGDKDEDGWLDAVVNVDDAASEGLLRRHGLGTARTRAARRRAVAKALERGDIEIADLERWRDDVLVADAAVRDLSQFQSRAPLLDEFWIARDGKPDTVATQEQRAREGLWRGDLELGGDWLRFWDPRRVESHRHLFLLDLGEGAWASLAEPAALARRLKDLGCGALASGEEYPWRPAMPTLVAAALEPTRGELRLRWVGWREEEGLDHPRAVQFARVDLRLGVAELQLQRRQLGGMGGLTAERDAYVAQIAELLDCRPQVVPLEPSMRRLLDADGLVLEMWRVRLPSGGELKGSRESGLFSRVQLAFRRHYALELKGKWSADDDIDLPVHLDARTDCIEVFWQGPASVVEGLLSEARRLAGERPAASAPAPVAVRAGKAAAADAAAEEPGAPATGSRDLGLEVELVLLVEKLVMYLRSLGHREMALRELWNRVTTADLHSTAGGLRSALERIGVRHLAASFYVMCPDTGRPVTRGGEVLSFERLADLPPRVPCEHHSGKQVEHHTEDNVWLQVLAPGAERERPTLRRIAAFLGLLVALVVLFVFLLGRFPDHIGFLWLGFVVGLLALLAAIPELVGILHADWAIKSLDKLLEPLRRWLGK